MQVLRRRKACSPIRRVKLPAARCRLDSYLGGGARTAPSVVSSFALATTVASLSDMINLGIYSPV